MKPPLTRASATVDASDNHASGALASRILRDRVKLLLDSHPLSVVLSFMVAILLVVQHQLFAPSPAQFYWLAGMSLVLAYRGAIAWRYFKQPHRPAPDSYWRSRAHLGSSLTGTAWGIGAIVFFNDSEPVLQVTLVLSYVGLAAAALNVLSPYFPTYRNYLLQVLVPLGVLSTLQFNQASTISGILMLLLLFFLLRSGRRTSNLIDQSLRLKHANEDLLEDLRQQQRNVVNQAEAMIGRLVDNAPVSLWVTDLQGRVSFVSAMDEDDPLQHPPVGSDLLQHFTDDPPIQAKLQTALRGGTHDFEIQRGERFYEVHLSPLLDDDKTHQGMIGVIIEVTERKHQEQELAYRANFDQLTGLSNRGYALEQVKQAFQRADRSETFVGLFFLDLDNFKAINDTMGHQVGDRLLQQTAHRLQSTLRECDFAARISGDEFLVLAENLHRPEHAENIAHKLTDCFRTSFTLGNRQLQATTSLGIAIYPRDGTSLSDLLQNADTAMYQAKASGRNRYCFFTAQMQREAERKHLIETELRQALQRGELHLHYQPKVDANSQHIVGAEVLLRWTSSLLGPVSPEEFVPVAEMAGLMPRIGSWIMHTACREFTNWPRGQQPLHLAINISPQQFRGGELLREVAETLASSDLKPESLELEITESLLVQDTPEIIQVLRQLNEMGLQLALDDFGTGYSSLSYLRKFPIQVLKIDKSFVQGLGLDSNSNSLVYAIISMAKSLNMQVVAEGVETYEQLRFLRDHEVDIIQGFYFQPPISASQFRQLLTAYQDQPLPPKHQIAQADKPLARSG